MIHRLALPILFFLIPRLGPPILKFLRLIWRLSFDKRVPLILRLLVPLALIYAVSPWDFAPDTIPILGRFDDLIVLGLAVLLLTKLAPKHVVDEHMGVEHSKDRPEEKDPSKIVDGSAHLVDED